MAKPEKQKSSGVSLLIDGVNAKRIQTLGVNTDIPIDQIEELANKGVVEFITDAPTVSIQIDSNDVGSTDTIALLTDKMIDYKAGDTDSAAANGARGGIYRHFIKTASSNTKEVTEQDMLNGYCSILATLDEDGLTAKRTMFMNHCAVTAVNLSYDVSGNAAANYTLSADNKTWLFNDWGNARCYKPTFGQMSSSADGFHFFGLSSAIPVGSEIIAVGINNVVLRDTSNGSGVSGNASFLPNVLTDSAFAVITSAVDNPAFSVSAGSLDRAWIYFKSSTNATFEAIASSSDPTQGWELESDAGAVGALRRGNIKAYLYNTGTDSEGTSTAAGRALRLQTVAMDVALGEEQLLELGTDGFYAISKNTPVPVTVTITANDSDLEYYALLTSTAAANTAVKAITSGDFNGNNACKVELYKDKAQTASNLLMTVFINKMRVTTENFNVSVGDNATNEITFTADNIRMTGAGTSTAAAVLGGWFGGN